MSNYHQFSIDDSYFVRLNLHLKYDTIQGLKEKGEMICQYLLSFLLIMRKKLY